MSQARQKAKSSNHVIRYLEAGPFDGGVSVVIRSIMSPDTDGNHHHQGLTPAVVRHRFEVYPNERYMPTHFSGRSF